MKRTSGQLVIALLLMLTIPFMVGAHDKSMKSKKSKKSEPVYITDRQPFQEQVIGRGGETAEVVFIEEVPAGALLVMQHVSLSGSLFTQIDTDAAFAGCSLFVKNRLDAETRLKLDVAVEHRGDDDEYLAEGPITFYANAGDEVRAVCDGFDDELFVPTSSMTLVGTLVGEFVPVGD
jgi:hypothetical protein